MYKTDEHLTELALSRDPDAMVEAADVIVYYEDRMYGDDIIETFNEGFALCQKAAGQDVWMVDDDTTQHFYIGSYGSVLAKLMALPTEGDAPAAPAGQEPAVPESFEARLGKVLTDGIKI
jgi:hypothetical protein